MNKSGSDRFRGATCARTTNRTEERRNVPRPTLPITHQHHAMGSGFGLFVWGRKW